MTDAEKIAHRFLEALAEGGPASDYLADGSNRGQLIIAAFAHLLNTHIIDPGRALDDR